jgi:alpha 1,2-mannosyltransferase
MQVQSLFAPTRRYRVLLLLAFLVILGIAFNCYHTFNSILGFPKFKAPSFSWDSKPPKFWPSFAPLLAKAAPRCSPPQRSSQNAVAKNRYYDDSWNLRPGQSWVVDNFPNLLNMTDDDIQSMQESHSTFVDLLNSEPPSLEYEKGTKGIVTSAGGSYFPVLIISLLILRRTGSNLPVEVFLATPEEYEPQICDLVLPTLNAKCIILSDLLKDSQHSFSIKKYQLKVFAILFSSFESLLFIDSDNFPIHPPEEFFDTAPFTTHNLVLWPDYWTSTVSPYFNTITGLDPELLQKRPTIESGQILVSKTHHSKTLLLAAYYNIFSEYFYILITQGGPGEGDKDTFASAALVLNSTFYTVESPPVNLGIRKHGGSAVVQYDPVVEAHCSGSCKPRPFFIHASWPPKLNALKNIESKRKWGKEEDSKKTFDGVDIEKVVWGYMVEVACNSKFEFRDWGHGDKSSTPVCEQTRKSFRDMFHLEYEGEESFPGDGSLT